MYQNTILLYLLIVSGFQYSNAQTCPNNRYNFNQAKETSTCMLWGNYNLKTFDDHGINFKSDCTFTMTSFAVGQSEFKIDIGGFNNVCRRTPAGCHTFIQILYNQVFYKLGLNDEGTATFTTDAKSYPIPTELDGLRVHQPGNRILVEFTKIGVVVKWNEQNMVEVTVENDRGYEMFGLCGNNDKCSSNDQMLINQIYTDDLKKFLEEWQVDKQSCPSNIDADKPCKGNAAKILKAKNGCQIINSGRLAEARKILNPDLYMEACIWNYCSCRAKKPMECLCDTVDSYVKASNNAGGKAIVWRDEDVCPYDCSVGLTYFPCRPNGGGQTCTDLEAPAGQAAQAGPCEEGCFCQANTFFFQGKCYIKKKCPCVFGGKVYQPGDTVQQRCHTCVCTDGKINCPTHPPCKKTATAVGDPHLTTFDGKRYDFMGKCSYYLVKGPGFSIESDHYVWENGQFVKNRASQAPSWIRQLTTKMGGVVVVFKPNLEVVVDGVQVTRFPHKAGRIVITKPSGSQVLAELPNDVDVQWDGYSLATIRVPDTLEGQIMGLLGTYTDDPNDDFMMPTGEIAKDPNTFGNSWKTEYSCEDQVVETPHPCDANPAARPAAERICSAIKGDLFKPCHIEDVETVYDNCLYDTCLCREDPNKCSCNNIEVAAQACGSQGILTNWRNSIPECRMPCPAGQVYQECGDSCARTCEDLSMRANCVATCVDGCNCAPGTTMDESGKCIPIQQCKCRIDGIVYPPNFQYLKSDTELLTCQNARWTTSVPTGNQQQDVPAENQLRDKCSAYEFAEYTPCRYPTPKTCQNMHIFEIIPIPNCEEGCECTDGFVLDAVNKACVRPDECPCFDKGQSYQEGNVVVREGCNRCVCMADGGWDCKEEDCEKLCIENEVKKIDECNSCRCQNALWECTNHDCTQQCKPGESKQIDCNSCTCDNGFWLCTERVCPKPGEECEPNSIKHEGCRVCICDNGQWKCNDDECVKESACGKEDDVKFNEYGKCVCKGGEWKCIKGQCDIWGDSHIKTFDGVRYDFQGDCSYTLVEGQVGSDKFSISFTNEICSQEGATCLKSFTVDVTVRGLGETVTFIKKEELPNTKHLRHIIVTDHYLFTTIKIFDAGVDIFWDKNTWVYVKLDENWQNRIKGLCSNYNRNRQDDLNGGQPRKGVNPVLAHVDNWRTEAECGKTKPNVNACNSTRLKWAEASCELLLGPVFAPCHNKVPVRSYYEACVVDSCKCDLGGDCDCLCTDLAMYAHQCNSFGIQIDWRSQKTCPIQCPTNTEYQTCVSPSCPPKTCETIRNNKTVNCEEEEELCFEGCGPKQLPPNKIYTDTTYEKSVDEEACTKQRCKDYFYDGEVTLQRPCLICVCVLGQESCMKLPCPDDSRKDKETTPNPRNPTDDSSIKPGYTSTPYVTGTPDISDGRSTPFKTGLTTKPPINVPVTKQPGEGSTDKDGRTTPNPGDGTAPTDSPDKPTTPIIVYPKTTTAKPNKETPCDESACPLLQCPPITKEIKLPGQCCKMCQHETKCVVKMQHNNNLVLKKVGHRWTDGPCRECECIGEEKYNHCASCRKKTCATVNQRNATIGNTYYEFRRGQCCPVMEAVACVHDNKLYRVGELWDIDRCTSAKCIKHASNNVTTVVETVEICNENCPDGFVYKKPQGSCCGECVQDSCFDVGGLRKPGETWTSADGCTNYTCTSVKGIYEITARKIICPSMQKCPGRVKKGRCCEYCDTSELFYWEKEASECEEDLIPAAV